MNVETTYEKYTVAGFRQYSDSGIEEMPFEPDEDVLYVNDPKISDGSSIIMEEDGATYRGTVQNGEIVSIDLFPILQREGYSSLTEIAKSDQDEYIIIYVFYPESWFANEVIFAPVKIYKIIFNFEEGDMLEYR